jgi:hypothetical protein
VSDHAGSDTGIFAGLFVASPAEVEAWDMTGLTPPGWPAIEFKRLDSVRLGKLEAILTDVRYEDIDRSQLHKLIRNGGEDGPWIMGVRQELIDALAELSADAAAAAGARWADTDEFKLRPTDPPRQQDIVDLTGRLAAMTGLARVSKQEGKPMLLLLSL